ncbi:hypothetical protein, partial [Klebsiella pneumoniae]|uniref:hypothetical protein n=1 Tax=Klebsiella pneumoniae TaxID=573 RepID=UPI0034E97131
HLPDDKVELLSVLFPLQEIALALVRDDVVGSPAKTASLVELQTAMLAATPATGHGTGRSIAPYEQLGGDFVPKVLEPGAELLVVVYYSAWIIYGEEGYKY